MIKIGINKILEEGNIFSNIFESLFKEVESKSLDKYLKKYKKIKKWLICSDYCIGDKEKKNNVSSFVIIPLLIDIPSLGKEIVLLKDFKKIGKIIPEEYIKYLKEMDYFVFNFVYSDTFLRVFEFDKNMEIEKILDHITRNKTNIKKLKMIKENMSRKNFPIKLYKTIAFNAIFICYLKFFLVKKTDIRKLYLLSDEDKMIDFLEEFIFYQIRGYDSKLYPNFLKDNKIENYIIKNKDNKTQLDPFIRIPDYFCGVIASFLDKEGVFTNEENLPQKYIQIINDVILYNENITTFIFKEIEDMIHINEVELKIR